MKASITPLATLLVAASISGAAAAEDESSSIGQFTAAMLTISKSIENPESLSESDWTDQLKCTAADMSSPNPTLNDESTCGSAKDADGEACIWCDATQTIGSGLCVSPSQKTMLGQYWDQLCAASSNNNTPDNNPPAPVPAVTTPPPTPNPTPSPTTKPTEPTPDPDDNVPDQMKCSMNGQSPIADQATCDAKEDKSTGASAGAHCVWCKVPILGGSCITTSMHNQMSWICQSEEEKTGNLRGDNNNKINDDGGFKELDPSCLGDQDGCASRVDSNGNACIYCSASDVFGICATPSQKDYLGEYMDCAEPAVDVVEEIPMAVE